jgi:hypothetical protein
MDWLPRHEQAVALRSAERDIGADLRQADATDGRGIRGEHDDAAVAQNGVRTAPQVAVDVDAHVGPAVDAVDHMPVKELWLVRLP